MTPQMQLLHDVVVDATQDTPYVVTDQDDGFDLILDLANAQWRTVFGQAKIKRAVIYEVRPKGPDYTITDVVKSVDWVAGAPGFSGKASIQRGRSIEFGVLKAWGVGPDGLPIKVADFSFATQEGRQLINLAGKSLGMSSRMGAAEKIALGFAAVAIVGAVVTVVALLGALALGKF